MVHCVTGLFQIVCPRLLTFKMSIGEREREKDRDRDRERQRQRERRRRRRRRRKERERGEKESKVRDVSNDEKSWTYQ